MKNFPNEQILISQCRNLLQSLLVRSNISSCAYDTAWLARLAIQYDERQFMVGFEWLRDMQHSDGSWGGDIFHYHDRIICTLATILALFELGDETDSERIQLGKNFLLSNIDKIHLDLMDTIGISLAVYSTSSRYICLRSYIF